ncbi:MULTISPECIES: L-lactate dehydrogenase, partial [unclassified Sphingomonas]|uniref:L-lactate dehydrogenase n=2 Tax=unclassified Sphingomonas TaxID=196159 RepID=UPI00082C2E8B
MIISSTADFREAARRRVPRFLFDYADGGAYAEDTMRRNVSDLSAIALRQRVLKDVATIDLTTQILGMQQDLPVMLGPVGISGMYARRGEVQAARAATRAGIPTCLSTVSICGIEDVAAAAPDRFWFQLYVIRDRGFMRDLIARAKAAGAKALVFTVDMPVPGARYRDAHSGMSGPNAAVRRVAQAMGKPGWAWDVGVMGRPHTLGNLAAVLGRNSGLNDYIGWLGANFDPSIQWRDLGWIRELWDGPLVIKGILDPDDAREAAALGADAIVVSNHGGRQLDGVMSSARALPTIADAVGDR